MSMFSKHRKCDLDEEDIEEIKMNTHFKRHEIIAYRKAFLYHTTRNLQPHPSSEPTPKNKKEKGGDGSSLDDDKKSETGSTTSASNSDDSKEKEKEKEKDKDKDIDKVSWSEASASTITHRTILKAPCSSFTPRFLSFTQPPNTPPPTDENPSETVPSEPAAPAGTTKKSQVVPFASTLSFNGSSIPELSSYPMSITRHQFLNIKSIAMNPLKERIALCFEFDEDPNSSISFEQYMQMAASFNRPGNREAKLKLAFKIQAMTDPKKIDRGDLRKYYELTARDGNIDSPVPKKIRKEVINKIMTECR